jgi:CHAT domain-containing protein
VDDAATLVLMRDFYAQTDWQTDPARALAQVQQARAARGATSNDVSTQARSWAAFSVLGRPPVIGVSSAQP